ncbi:hypothetical protein HMPREF1548_00808 [Clostridium sp. KLE 1755]|nr:hypothetical protein HMPREF1548_00808 [Clostridium sp. KLE 1755]
MSCFIGFSPYSFFLPISTKSNEGGITFLLSSSVQAPPVH